MGAFTRHGRPNPGNVKNDGTMSRIEAPDVVHCWEYPGRSRAEMRVRYVNWRANPEFLIGFIVPRRGKHTDCQKQQRLFPTYGQAAGQVGMQLPLEPRKARDHRTSADGILQLS